MSRANVSILFWGLLLLSFITLLTFYCTRIEDEDFGCQSDNISWKTYSSGDSVKMSLKTLVLFNSDEVVTVIHKGVLRKKGQNYLIDRNYTLNIQKVESSNIYYIKKKKLSKNKDDTAPDSIINEMLLDNVDFYSFISIKKNTWLIKGLVLPVMMCMSVPKNN